MKKKSMRTAGRFLGIIAMTAGIFLYTSCEEPKDDNKPEPDPKEKFHIYLAFGQSNMVGYLGPPIGSGGSSSSQKWVTDNKFDTLPENFVVMAAANDKYNPYSRKIGEWYGAKPPLVRNNTGLSPADYFGRTIAEEVENNGIKVGVIVIAVDGCRINLFAKDIDTFKAYVGSADSWVKNQSLAYVDSIVNSITSANFNTVDYPYKRLVDLAIKAQEEGAIIKGIIMHQGESGGNFSGKTYAQSVRQIYDDLCEDLGLEKGKVPFLAGQAVGNKSSDINTIPNAFNDIPNTAFVIPSDGCPAWDPNKPHNWNDNETIHFGFDGYKELGTRYGEKMLELLY